MSLATVPRELRRCELALVETLFDALPDVVFFVKDCEGCYRVVNHTLVRRSAARSKHALLGRTTREVFPGAMGERFWAQDQAVLASGRAVQRQLELHVYADRRSGWCLTDKLPLRDDEGQICGVAGISRDLGMPDERHPVYSQVAEIAAHIREHFAEPVHLGRLARAAGLSLERVERLFQRVFHISPRDMLLQARLDAARGLLESTTAQSVAAIAMSCGYSDQSAFARQFKATVGLTPTQYRALHQPTLRLAA